MNADLMMAAKNGDVKLVGDLLDQGAEVYYQDEEGVSPLMVAAGGGHAEVVELLLLEGAPWNAQDKSGRCAGEYALKEDQHAVAQQLIDAGCRAELVLGKLDQQLGRAPGAPNDSYLTSKLTFTDKSIIDDGGEAVMMQWENPLMEAHAAAICPESNTLEVLNIGFGMGLIDDALQARHPLKHTIVEAHPDIWQHMLDKGWGEKPNVVMVKGRWQDVWQSLGKFDGIFFDTYGEYYPDIKEFHQLLPNLLKPTGLYSFFNGFAPDNPFFHAVYCQLVEMDMHRLGLDTHFVDLNMSVVEGEWAQVRHRYYWNDTYFLPVCQLREEKGEGGGGEGGD